MVGGESGRLCASSRRFRGGDSDEPDPPKEQMRESFLAANKRIYEENKLRRSAEAVAGTHAACLAWDAGRHPTGSAPLLPLQPPGLTPWPKLRRSGPPPPVPPEPPATPATPATPARVMATAGLALEKRRQVLHLAAAPAAGQVGPKATPAAATQPTAATAPMPPPSGALYRLFYKAAQTSNGAGPVNEPAPSPTAPASTLPPDHYAAEGVHSNTGQAAPEFEIAPVGMASSDSDFEDDGGRDGLTPATPMQKSINQMLWGMARRRPDGRAAGSDRVALTPTRRRTARPFVLGRQRANTPKRQVSTRREMAVREPAR